MKKEYEEQTDEIPGTSFEDESVSNSRMKYKPNAVRIVKGVRKEKINFTNSYTSNREIEDV